MIRARYLADVRGVRVGVQADLDQIAQSGGDFHAEALGAELEEASAPRHVVAAHRAHARDRKTLVFVPTVALAHTIARAFRAAGTPAEALDGGTPSEMRRAILERLRRGETQLVANVGVLSEGFDEPSVDCVVMATPTRSQVKYAQCVGRALRPFPDKRDCLVIDVVGVSDRLDLQTLPRLFDLRGQPDPAITVTEALERQSTRERTPAGRPATSPRARGGAIRSRDVQLLGPRRRGRLHWLRHERYWLLPAAGGSLLALVPAGERWTVIRLDRDGHQPIAGEVDLGYAQGIAEDYVRATGARRLADPRAAWRRAPMTPAQANSLHRLGVPIPADATKRRRVGPDRARRRHPPARPAHQPRRLTPPANGPRANRP